MSHKVVRLVVLGDGAVGKTALTIQLCHNHFVETYDPTIEDSYRKQVMVDERPCNLEILDTAGQEEYTSLRDQWIRDGDGFLLVYSITSRDTFFRIERFRDQIMRVKETDETIPMILIGNKSDLFMERDVSKEEGQHLAKRLGCDFIETSAKSRLNVERAFHSLIRQVRLTQAQQRRPRGIKRSTENGDKRDCILM